MTLVIVEGRLAQRAEYENRAKHPPMFMYRLSAAEVTALKAKVAASNRPPAADAPAEARLKFLVFKATPGQADELLRTQKDLVTLKTPAGETALCLLSNSSKPTKLVIAEKLLAAGADASPLSRYGNKPLIRELFSSNPDREKDFIKLLVKHGVKIDEANKDNESLLIAYCRNGKDTEFLKWMLDAGADINRKDTWRRTALSSAIEAGWADGAGLLLDRGAEIKGLSGLIKSAVERRNIGLLKKLAEKGLTQDDSSKQTALVCALEEINRLTGILKDARPSSFGSTDYAKQKADLIAFVPVLIEHDKSRLEAQDHQGKTALLYARDVEIAKALLDAGASLKCGGQITPLHVAAMTSPELISF